MTDKQLVLGAADAMESLGWNGHIRQDSDGTVCVLGALSVASGTDPLNDSIEHHPVINELERLLGLQTRHGGYDLPLVRWSNGSNGKTVVRELRRVAELLPSDGKVL